MGKLFIKLGKSLVKLNWKLKCKYNKVMSKLLFDLTDCPIEGCECKE